MNHQEPAFPVHPQVVGTPVGLTKLEYAAIQIAAGYESVPDERICPKDRMADVDAWRDELKVLNAKHCVKVAKALLAELDK